MIEETPGGYRQLYVGNELQINPNAYDDEDDFYSPEVSVSIQNSLVLTEALPELNRAESIIQQAIGRCFVPF